MALRVPATAHTWSHERGSLDIWLASPEVVVQRLRGHATREAAHEVTRFLEPLVASGTTLTLFDDWEDVTGYDSDGRLVLTSWTDRHRASFRAIHVLVRSKLLAMGVSVANLATGGINICHSSRDDFERELAKALTRSTPPSAR